MPSIIRFVSRRAPYNDSISWNDPADAARAVDDFIDERDGNVSTYLAASQDYVGRVVAAFALSHPNRLQSRFCIVLDLEIFHRETNLTLDDSELGVTPDHDVNRSHRNIRRPTADDSLLCALIFGKYGALHSYSAADVERLATASISKGYIDEALLKPPMKSWLERNSLL